MTRSARGTLDNPGRNVRQKASLNSALLDSAPGELRHQVTYKSNWYGSHTAVLHRKWPSSKTCSACGWRHPSLTLADSSTAPPAVCASTATSTPPTTSSGTPRLPLEQGRRPWRERKSCRPPGRKADPQKREDPAPAGPPRRSNPPVTHTARGTTAPAGRPKTSKKRATRAHHRSSRTVRSPPAWVIPPRGATTAVLRGPVPARVGDPPTRRLKGSVTDFQGVMSCWADR